MFLFSFISSYVETLVRGEELGHGAEHDGVGVLGVERRGRVAHHGPGRHQLRAHLRQLELRVLEVGDGLAELLAHLDVLAGGVEASLGGAERAGGWN